jgi:hypothetical protein
VTVSSESSLEKFIDFLNSEKIAKVLGDLVTKEPDLTLRVVEKTFAKA